MRTTCNKVLLIVILAMLVVINVFTVGSIIVKKALALSQKQHIQEHFDIQQHFELQIQHNLLSKISDAAHSLLALNNHDLSGLARTIR